MSTTRPLPLSVLASIDEVVRDSAIASLLLDSPGTVVVRHDLRPDEGTLRRFVIDATGVVEDVVVPMDHPCVLCSMREDAVPTLARLAATARWTDLVLALPLTASPLPVVRALAPMTGFGGALAALRLATTVAVVDLDTLQEDLLGDMTVDECELALTDDDERPVGEALAGILEPVDLVVTTGTCATGSGLVDRIRGAGTRRIDGLFELTVGDLVSARLDPDLVERRADPLVAPAEALWSGMPDDRSWTLLLSSPLPLHPERLLEHVEELGRGRVRSRGVFHLPDRPDSVCMWDGAGNQLCIADLGTWDEEGGGQEPCTRIVVVGAGDDGEARATQERLLAVFSAVLATPAELLDGGLAWLGREDVLAPWLGSRTPQATSDLP